MRDLRRRGSNRCAGTPVTARDPFGKQRICRGCGCSEHNACVVATPAGLAGCAWVLLDLDSASGLCSACAVKLRWSQRAFYEIGFAEPEDERLLVAAR